MLFYQTHVDVTTHVYVTSHVVSCLRQEARGDPQTSMTKQHGIDYVMFLSIYLLLYLCVVVVVVVIGVGTGMTGGDLNPEERKLRRRDERLEDISARDRNPVQTLAIWERRVDYRPPGRPRMWGDDDEDHTVLATTRIRLSEPVGT